MEISRIQKHLSAIEYTLDQLTTGKPTSKQRRALSERIERSLKPLQRLAAQAQSTHSASLRDRALQVLGRAASAAQQFGEAELSLEIRSVQAELQNTSPAPEAKTPLHLHFVLDLDAPDFNAAEALVLSHLLPQDIPIVTTRYLINGTGIGEDDLARGRHERLRDALCENQHNYDIFALDSVHCGQALILFLPKRLLPELGADQKLRALDFAADVLEPCSATELFSARTLRSASSFALRELFSDRPKRNKVFSLNGHGDSATIGSMSLQAYRGFLRLCEDQNCIGLSVASCGASGSPSLLHQAQDTRQEASFDSEAYPSSFPVVMHATGDFVSSTSPRQAANMGPFLEGFGQLAQSGKLSEQSLAAQMGKLYGDQPPSNPARARLLLPHAELTQRPFRNVGEDPHLFRLSMHELRTAQLEAQHPNSRRQGSSGQAAISVQNQDLILLHPVQVDVPLHVGAEHIPCLISMIPGKALHVLSEIRCTGAFSAAQFLELQLDNYEMIMGLSGMYAQKAFLIERLQDVQELLEDAVIFVDASSGEDAAFSAARSAYKKDGQHWLQQKGERRPISPLLYQLLRWRALQSCQPSAQAVASASAGQQVTPELGLRDLPWQELSRQELCALEPDEVHALLGCLFALRQSSHAQSLLELHPELDPSSSDLLTGRSLLTSVLRQNDAQLLSHVLEHAAEAGTLRFSGHSPSLMRTAVTFCSWPLIAELLKQEPELISKCSEDPRILALAAQRSDEILPRLLHAGADINAQASDGQTALSRAIRSAPTSQAAARLITAGAKVDDAIASPLLCALERGDLARVRLLLQAGADPLQPDAQGRIPLVEALQRASGRIMTLLLEYSGAAINHVDSQGVNAYLAALVSGRYDLMKRLHAKGASLPSPLTAEAQDLLDQAKRREAALKN